MDAPLGDVIPQPSRCGAKVNIRSYFIAWYVSCERRGSHA
jgi:hypothetical protein